MIDTVKGNGVLKAYIEVEVRDKDGKITEKRIIPCKSFVANFLRAFRRLIMTEGRSAGGSATQACGFSDVEPQDTTPTARGVFIGTATGSYPVDRPVMKIDAPIGIVTSGIRVGTNDTAPTIADYNILSPIAHGTGAGQLSHSAVTIDTLLESAPNVTLKIIRVFTNNSAGLITVKEIGLLYYGTITATPTYATFLLARDVPSPAIDVPVGQSLTLRYVLTTTV